MKIRLLSDLHHEFFKRRDFYAEPFFEYRGEDVLVLAGDIAVGAINVVDVIGEFLVRGFPYVVYVTGNHEYYGSTLNNVNNELESRLAKFGNKVLFLNQRYAKIGDIWFGGGTLWTNFRERQDSKVAAQFGISDFNVINNFTVTKCLEQYYKDKSSITNFYESVPFDEKKVIVTHFLPATECIAPMYRGDTSMLNDYFANNLGHYISGLSNTTWMFGHTHSQVDTIIGNTRLFANPHGYIGYETQRGFEPFFTIEV